MSARPLVTLIVPTLRRPVYLRLTLRSVLSQDYTPLEVIVSDNGSGDTTPEVVAEFSDHRLRFRRNETTVDMPAHVNQCLDESKGEFVAVISDDDFITSNFTSELVSCFDAHPNAAVGLTQCDIINDCGAVVASLPTLKEECQSGAEFVVDWLWGQQPTPTATFLSLFARTEQVRAAGGFPSFPIGANSDNALFLALALTGDVVFSRHAQFQYRVYQASYGLSMPLNLLARSAKDFQEYLDTNPYISEALLRLPTDQQRFVKRGVARMLANQYLSRVQGKYLSSRLTITEYLRALRFYQFNAAYLNALPASFASTFAKKCFSSHS